MKGVKRELEVNDVGGGGGDAVVVEESVLY